MTSPGFVLKPLLPVCQRATSIRRNRDGLWNVTWGDFHGKCFYYYRSAQRWAFCFLTQDVDASTPSGV